MNHFELQREVLILAHGLKVFPHHCDMRTATAMGAEPGFPDLVLIGRRGVLWREIKIPPDKPSTAQRRLGYRLQSAGQDWRVWTPADFPATVRRELQEIA